VTYQLDFESPMQLIISIRKKVVVEVSSPNI